MSWGCTSSSPVPGWGAKGACQVVAPVGELAGRRRGELEWEEGTSKVGSGRPSWGRLEETARMFDEGSELGASSVSFGGEEWEWGKQAGWRAGGARGGTPVGRCRWSWRARSGLQRNRGVTGAKWRATPGGEARRGCCGSGLGGSGGAARAARSGESPSGGGELQGGWVGGRSHTGGRVSSGGSCMTA